jgi:hypothetical protein
VRPAPLDGTPKLKVNDGWLVGCSGGIISLNGILEIIVTNE